MTTTLVTMRNDVRAHLDEATATLWTDAQINTWINQGLVDIARRTAEESAKDAGALRLGTSLFGEHGFATFSITARRRSSTEDLIAWRGWGGIDAETVWQMPTVFIGSLTQIREDLRARHERFGLSYLVTPDHDLPMLIEIIAGL